MSSYEGEIPSLGFGTWKAEPGKVGKAVEVALKSGYKHIDCAALYGNEKEVGEALNNAFSNGLKRSEVWITSKLWNTDWHDVKTAVKKTLSDLGLECLDLYLVHTPAAWKYADGEMWKMGEDGKCEMGTTPVHVMWAAMEKLVDEGLVKHIGISNFPCLMVHDLFTYARIKPYAQQIEIHPYFQQEGNTKYCMSKGLKVTGYSPLGNAKGGGPLHDDVVKDIANDIGASPGQVLIAWSLKKGHQCIPKSTTPSRIEENFASTEFIEKLTLDHMANLDNLEKGMRTCDLAQFWSWPFYE